MADQKPTDRKRTDRNGSAPESAGREPGGGKTGEGKTGEGKPGDGESAEQERADPESGNRQPAGQEPADPLGYEQARDELIDVVRRLETGGATLEESLALWERGEHLAKVCRHWLEGARERLNAALAAEEDEGELASPEQG